MHGAQDAGHQGWHWRILRLSIPALNREVSWGFSPQQKSDLGIYRSVDVMYTYLLTESSTFKYQYSYGNSFKMTGYPTEKQFLYRNHSVNVCNEAKMIFRFINLS